MKANSLFLYEKDIATNKVTKAPIFRCFLPFKKNDLKWYLKHEDVLEVCIWIDTNIIENMESLTYITIGVLIRIATGMLCKCSINDNTDVNPLIIMHTHLINNIWELYNKQINKDLPF